MPAVYKQVREGARVYREGDGRAGAWLTLKEGAALPSCITLEGALSDKSLGATFLFSSPPLPADSEDDIARIIDVCAHAAGGERGIVWYDGGNTVAMLLTQGGDRLAARFEAHVSCALSVIVKNGAKVSLSEAEGRVDFAAQPPFYFSNDKNHATFSNAAVVLLGANGGVIVFDVYLVSGWFDDLFKCGFDYSYTGADGKARLMTVPFWETSPSDQYMRFSLYPCDISLSGAEFINQVTTVSPFRTLYGEHITMTAKEGDGGGFGFMRENVPYSPNSVSPRGKYSVTTASNSAIRLLCGLSGTEYIEMEQGGVIEFAPCMPAYAPRFPCEGLSIGDFVYAAPAIPLNQTYVTSWMRAQGKYYSQPSDAPLFTGPGGILTPADLAVPLPDDAPFVPALPLAAYPEKGSIPYLSPPETAAEFEKSVVMNTRAGMMSAALLPRLGCFGLTGRTAATASGYVAELSTGGGFGRIAVAYSSVCDMGFLSPSEHVTAAFRDAGMMVVLANPLSTGGFDGRLNIEDWTFDVDIGAGSVRNDYRNIVIIKSAKGRLYDPDTPSESLCANPFRWTGRERFSAPMDGGELRPSQTANLSAWLLGYLRDAYEKRENPYFTGLASVITDEDWQGFLALNVTADGEAFPDCLKGLLAGVKGAGISLHHLGSRITPLKPGIDGPLNDGYSPFFGLIYYEAEGFSGDALPPSDPDADYDFTLLELKTLFENGAVKKFVSASQFVMGRFFGVKPSVRSIPYNALLLRGSLQNVSGVSVLTLESDGGMLVFDGAPFDTVNVTGLSMASTDPAAMHFTFSVSGAATFPAPAPGAADLFSYDELLFSSYAVQMRDGVFTVDLSRLGFDLEHSAARDGSLCHVFYPTPLGAVFGSASKLPGDFGYTPLAADKVKNGTFQSDWAGLEFSLPLGTLGSLAEGSVFRARLLLAWDGAGVRFAGIAMPGSALVENVIGLTMGQARLTFRDGKLTLFVAGIAVELLGMLKLPPSGTISLAISGGDGGTGWFGAYKK